MTDNAANIQALNWTTRRAVAKSKWCPRFAFPLARLRYQLIFGYFFAVILPVLLLASVRGPIVEFDEAILILLSTSLAMLSGFLFLRRMIVFPGIYLIASVVPAFIASYGMTTAGLLLFRPEALSIELFLSFFYAICFFSYALVVERYVRRPCFAYMAVGALADPPQLERADWIQWPQTGQLPSAADAVVADLRANLGRKREALLTDCVLNGIQVFHYKQVYESLTGRVQIEHLSENSLGSLNPSSIYTRIKRIVDVAGAIVALPVIAPMLALLGVAIRWESPGSAFFAQERMGYRGNAFKIWKLRTMRDDVDGALYTEDTDSRITRIGRVLRKYRIDELPQIYNILRGEMSWIGPRPEATGLYEWYARELGFYDYRHIVRPGISGWAQIHQGWAAMPEDVLEKLHYDFFYIKHLSPWLDIVIAAQTVRVVLTGFGSR